MEVAWVDFLLWAIESRPLRERFVAETGLAFYLPPQSHLEALINKACGVNPRQHLEAFIRWATKNYWGDEYAPELYRRAVQTVTTLRSDHRGK